MACAHRGLLPPGLLFDIGPVLALLALAGDALTLKLLLEQVAFLRYARPLQSKLLRNPLGGLQLPVAAQVSQQRYQVAAFITAGKVVPPARYQVDTERPRLAIAAYRVGWPVFIAFALAVRQPVGEQNGRHRQGGLGNTKNLQRKDHQ